MEDSKFVLDKKDIGFFLPFGALISLMIWLLDGVSVPAQMDRGFWQDLFFDHIPFGTIGLLFVVSCLLDLMTVYLPKGRVGEFFKSQKEHIADRVWQLSSPAIFTIIGIIVVQKYYSWGTFRELYSNSIKDLSKTRAPKG